MKVDCPGTVLIGTLTNFGITTSWEYTVLFGVKCVPYSYTRVALTKRKVGVPFFVKTRHEQGRMQLVCAYMCMC